MWQFRRPAPSTARTLAGLLAGCLWLGAVGAAAAQDRGLGQPWPDTRPTYRTDSDIGQPGESWSLFSATRLSSRSLGPVDCYPPRRSVYVDRPGPAVMPALRRTFHADWSSTNRSPWFDTGYTSYTSFGIPWSGTYFYGGFGGFGGFGGGWGGFGPVGFGGWYRPWYASPYAARPWWGGYGPYYGGGYASFYRPWYLYAPGSSYWWNYYQPQPGWSAYRPPLAGWGLGAWACPDVAADVAGAGPLAGCYYW